MDGKTARRALGAALLAGLLALAGCGRSASWSGDSRSLALDPGGKLQLFDLTTGMFTPLDTGGRYALNPVFSPNGKQVAYYGIAHADGRSERCDLWLRDIEAPAGSDQKLAGDVAPADTGGPRESATELKPLLQLSWSPEGRRLAYARTTRNEGAIELLDVDSGTVTRLGREREFQFQPAWSPDGERIAYLAHETVRGLKNPGQVFSLYVSDPAGRQRTLLWQGSGLWPFWPLAWSQDGTRLVFLKQQRVGEHRFELRAQPVLDGSSELLTLVDTPQGSVAPDLRSVVYIGTDQDSVIYRQAPFTEARVLDRIGETTAREPEPLQARTAPPYPVLSGDGKTVALPLMDRRRELRLYHLETGRKSVYPIP